MQEADPIESYRLQANLKSIHRSDTAVQAILSSSNYATIYHYEQDAGPTGEGEWVKQKAEGPLFVVQRNTSPEHAIFMLNRQTVKNVTIPLVRGEMKVTAVGAGMLQIARRGERRCYTFLTKEWRVYQVRRGVWFSEGEGTVERFRQTILQICGEPSARPATTQANANPATVNAQGGVPPVSNTAHDASSSNGPALGAADAGQDGLSRLFAGLMPTATSNQSAGQSGSNGSNSQLPMSNVPPAPQEQQAPTVQEHQPIQTKSPSPAPPPAPAQSFHRPGETVDDLLNSILGIGGAGKGMGANRPPVAQSAPPMPVPGNLTNAGVTQPRPDAPHHQSSFGAVPDRAQTPSHPTPPEFLHVGTASPFPSGPGPAGPGPNRSQSPFVHNGPSPAHHAVGSPLVNGTGKGQQRPNGVSDQIPHQVAPNSQQGPPMPGLNMAHQLNNDCTDRGVVARTAVVDVLGRAMPDMRQGGKEGLAKTVAALIANEPRFVDDLWEAYIRRLGGTPG